jgi:glycosyltransferase involved in cell wall biosynthesis
MRITIGVWIYAEPSSLHRTLDSVQQHTAQPVRLLLLPDGADAPTTAALARLRDVPQLPTEQALGAPACFNRLLSYDQADVVVFLESGSVVTPGWLERLCEALSAHPSHGLAGPSTNRSWNAQRLAGTPGAAASAPSLEAFAAAVARRYHGAYRTLEPLYSLADFCYVVQRRVIEAIGGADARYGLGPCWEMDYNIRAARAGFKGVWACGAYVHRLPPAAIRLRHESRFLPASKQHYQDKFCRLKLARLTPAYHDHCQGEVCEHFAPHDLIQLRLPLAAPTARQVDSTPVVRGERAGQRAEDSADSDAGKVERDTWPVARDRLPLVSCIMPTYNRRPFVAQAIAYFLRQDYARRELLIVDDGTDPINDLVPQDQRIRYIRQAHKHTVGAKRNLACTEAQGEIIVHWDDDDWMAPGRLSYQVASLLREQADLCGLSTVLFYDPRAERAWQYIYPPGDRPWVAGGTLCYTKAFWKSNPFADTNVGEDTRFVWTSPAKRLIAHTDSTFYVALLHAANTSPKRLADSRWRPHPAAEIRRLIGPDGAFYTELWQLQKNSVDSKHHTPAMPLPAAQEVPLVSCIMPTYNRRRFVPQAIKYFLQQDYPNRELIVVDDGTEPAGDLLPQNPSIRYTRLPTKQSIGAKRNLACQAARGDIILCWDDDDWYAPHRISYQVAPLLHGKADVTGFDKSLLLSLPTQQFWAYTSRLHTRLFVQGIVGGTLAFWKRLWNQGARFPNASLAEDATFLQILLRRGARLERLANAGMFIYVRHATNSWRFVPGHFLDPSAWQQVEPPSFIPATDCAFYGISQQSGEC